LELSESAQRADTAIYYPTSTGISPVPSTDAQGGVGVLNVRPGTTNFTLRRLSDRLPLIGRDVFTVARTVTSVMTSPRY
jgi:hypothetical protein